MNSKSLAAMLRNRRNRKQLYSTPDYWNSKAVELEGDAVSMWPNNNLNRLYHREQLAVIDSLLPSVDGLSVLDLGCGTGRIARHLAERGAIVEGVDFSERAIEIARKVSTGTNPTYRVGSMFDLSAEDQYDVVVSWGSVAIACKDAEELVVVMRGIVRASRPGARILLLEPIHTGFLHRVLDLSIPEFEAVMRAAGIHVTETRPLHFWPARLALSYVQLPNFLTAPGYHLGQSVMRAIPALQLGDYTAMAGTVEK